MNVVRRAVTKTNPISSRSRRKKGNRFFWVPLCSWIAVALSACTNNLTLPSNTSSVTASNPTVLTNSGNDGGTFTLARALKNSTNPSAILDLVGDGSGTFGDLCKSSDGTTGTTTTSGCTCTLAYGTEQQDVPVSYVENDLVRCSYVGVPANVTSFKVSVHVTSSDSYSNALTFKFSGSGVTLDTSDPDSFVQPIRYQCRDIVVIPYLLDGSIYDPLQSESYRLTWPIDFYASNLGNAISVYASAIGSNPNLIYWNCPPILNPTNTLSSLALTLFNTVNHINLTVYSKGSLSGSKLIYPPAAGIFDRSTFYLAKKASGIFNVPVDAYQSPGIITADNTVYPPLGYGATPVPTGSGQETCPDTATTIPTGYHWVKLWLFRASLPQRHFVTSPDIQQQVQSVTCNPGDWTGGTPIYSGCTKTVANGGTGYGMGDLNATHFLADRVLGTQQCVRLDDGTGPSCGAHPGAGCSGNADYWMAWVPNTAAYPNSANLGCNANPVVDPLSVCSYNNNNNLSTNPITYNVGIGNLDTSGARYDFLFVVTPPSITVSDMQDTTSSASQPYQPYRFFTDQDCLSTDPDNPTVPGDCLASNAINNYGLKLHDVGSNGDPPANDPNRAGVFPVCAIQPDL